MDSLQARLGAAVGADRELDCEIAAHVGWDDWTPAEWAATVASIEPKDPLNPPTMVRCPAYTGSIDAAMTLVPEGWDGSIHFGAQPGANLDTDGGMREIDAQAATPALALCLACLRARNIE